MHAHEAVKEHIPMSNIVRVYLMGRSLLEYIVNANPFEINLV